MKRFTEWLIGKWTREKDENIKEAYRVAFTTFHGRLVLDHLLSNVYCQVYEGSDPIAGAQHHGRRSVVHEILEIIDQAEHPERYKVVVIGEEVLHSYGE